MCFLEWAQYICEDEFFLRSIIFCSVISFVVSLVCVYCVLFFILWIRRKRAERKRCHAEISKKVFYTLPERENEYVRTRLNTALQCKENGLNEDMDIGNEQIKPIKLGYAKQLLTEVRNAPLSPAERLQAEEMSRAFSMYLVKKSWTAEDIRAVNELCASLLKLCAKYAV